MKKMKTRWKDPYRCYYEGPAGKVEVHGAFR